MLVRALLERGDVVGAVEAAGEEDPGEDTSFMVTLLAARGEARAAAGRLDEGLDDLRRAAAWCERKALGEPVGEEIFRRRELALALQRAGEQEEARAIAALALAQARQVGAPRLLGESLRAHALVVGGADGLAQLHEAVEILAGSPGRLADAKALVDLGAALRRANLRADARDPLRRGLDLARRCGATGLAQRAETELRATGAKPRRLQLTGVESLTPSELRVAHLAAAGRTNREIAQELFVTLRTVEGHLSNAFRKLDVSSRSELAGALG
jgi:DNA-binding CsgD family transcriptional regulator